MFVNIFSYYSLVIFCSGSEFLTVFVTLQSPRVVT